MSVSIAAFAADPQCVKALVGGVGICVWMNSVCTPSGGTALRVGRPRVGMNLRGDQDVWARVDVWDGPASSCAMEPMS